MDEILADVLTNEEMHKIINGGRAKQVAETGAYSIRPVYEIDADWYEQVYDIKAWFVKYVKCTPERKQEIINSGRLVEEK